MIAGEIAARLLSGSDASVAATDVARSLDYLRPCARVEERDGKRVLAIEQDGETTAVFPVDKAPSVLRIAVVGESTAAMLANALHDVLAQTGRADRVEVLPCAVPGAALEHVERRAAEVLDYSPDVLFVVFGHNLMIAYSTHDWLLRARALLSHSRLIAGLPGFRAGSHAWAPAQRERRIRELDGWLRELAGRARERGVAVASMTLTANLWFPPGGSHATLSDARFLAARLERAQGDGARATEALAALVEQQPEPYWQFVLGTWLARSGDVKGAALRLEAAVDTESIEPDRRLSAVNTVIRDVAQDEGILLVDSDAYVRASSSDGLPGWSVMRDHCHLLNRYLSAAAIRLLRLVNPAEFAGTPAELPPLKPVSLSDQLVWILHGLASMEGAHPEATAPRYRTAIAYLVEYFARNSPAELRTAVAGYTAGAAFASIHVPTRRAGLLCGIAQGYWEAGLREDAFALNAAARSEDAAEPWVQLGLFRVADGNEAAAIEAFRNALAKDPERTDAQFFLSALHDRAAQ